MLPEAICSQSSTSYTILPLSAGAKIFLNRGKEAKCFQTRGAVSFTPSGNPQCTATIKSVVFWPAEKVKNLIPENVIIQHNNNIIIT